MGGKKRHEVIPPLRVFTFRIVSTGMKFPVTLPYENASYVCVHHTRCVECEKNGEEFPTLCIAGFDVKTSGDGSAKVAKAHCVRCGTEVGELRAVAGNRGGINKEPAQSAYGKVFT